MRDLAKIIGQRIRSYRTQQSLSQEKLAELCGCHPTYIGQLERGEKNATLESIDRIAASLNISLYKLFENLGEKERKLITLRYFEDRTQTEVAKELGISQVQVSRLEKKILGSIRKEFY